LRGRGFTLVELAVAVVIVAIVAGYLLDRTLALIGRAERTAFMQVSSQLRSALLLEAAEKLTRGEAAALADLAGTNPMSLLLAAPANYRGATSRLPATPGGHASWYYDVQHGRLVYFVGSRSKFRAISGPSDRIELVVDFIYTDRNASGAYEPSSDEFDGLRLASVYPYDWPE
jgi:prepilin-type N-terminal cleavage/methylation domain-containing protein